MSVFGSPYSPVIRVNGHRLTPGATVIEERDISGVFVRSVHIEDPGLEVRRKDNE